MNKTPLFEFEETLNANFKNINEWQLAKDYGNKTKEVSNTRNGLTFCDISNRGKLRLSGKDHLKLLQGMLTNDVLNLKTGEGNLSAVLTNKGRVISDMRVYKDEGSVFLDTEPGLNKKLKDHLLKFRLSYKAEIDDVTKDYGLVHISGTKCIDFLTDSFNIGRDNLDEYEHIKENGIKIIKINRTGDLGFDIQFENNMSDKIINLISSPAFNIKPAGLEAMEIMRIEAGIPKYGVDIDERTIPIEAGLWSALDFEKGCYVGQEVVARIKWRGRVNRHLVSLRVEGEKVPGPKDKIISDEKEIGKITSSVFSPTVNKVIALGYIRREFKDHGSKAEVLFSDGSKTGVEVIENSFHQRFS